MHQCVKCNTFYPDASNEILKGCAKCGGRFFFFIRKEHLERKQGIAEQLSPEDKTKIEEDVKEIMGETYKEDTPVILDLASVNILKPGKFELDLVRLFKGDPLVYKLDEGKYIIDVAATFQKNRKQKL